MKFHFQAFDTSDGYLWSKNECFTKPGCCSLHLLLAAVSILGIKGDSTSTHSSKILVEIQTLKKIAFIHSCEVKDEKCQKKR